MTDVEPETYVADVDATDSGIVLFNTEDEWITADDWVDAREMQ